MHITKHLVPRAWWSGNVSRALLKRVITVIGLIGSSSSFVNLIFTAPLALVEMNDEAIASSSANQKV